MDVASYITASCQNTLSGVSVQLFLSLINTLIGTQCYFSSENHYPPDYGPNLFDGEEFDFIVVGSGSAGSVVANKLSENKNWRVLVLEAGGYPSVTSDIPALLFSIQETDEDWKYWTEPSDKCCLSMKDRRCRWPRGKLLGGCSSINAMLYIRGNKRDYDDWAKAGNTGWDYKSVLKHFNAVENLTVEGLHSYGKDGYLTLVQNHADQPIRTIIQEAGMEMGVPTVKQESPIGYFDALMNVENGVRLNTARAFLGKVRDRTNLHLAVNAHVNKIIIDKETKTAKAVHVTLNGKDITLHAKKEIVISSGAINTPHILMLSGIGPKQHLESLDIDVIADLKVGENLQDHLFFPGVVVNVKDEVVKDLQAYEKINEIYKYFMYRTGELASVGLTNFAGFINTRKDSEYANIEIHHVLGVKQDDYLLNEVLRSANFIDEYQNEQREANKLSHSVMFLSVLLNPKSAGKILLKSSDPKEHPLIYPNYLENEEDLKVILEGIRYVEALTETEAFKKAEPEIIQINIPNCRQYKFRSDDYWKCAIRNLGTTLYHPSGTAKMGPKSDPSAVVDPKLKVHGVKNLRVADASIMPKIVSANTNAASMMIGHKCGSMILQEWSNSHDEL